MPLKSINQSYLYNISSAVIVTFVKVNFNFYCYFRKIYFRKKCSWRFQLILYIHLTLILSLKMFYDHYIMFIRNYIYLKIFIGYFVRNNLWFRYNHSELVYFSYVSNMVKRKAVRAEKSASHNEEKTEDVVVLPPVISSDEPPAKRVIWKIHFYYVFFLFFIVLFMVTSYSDPRVQVKNLNYL